MTIKKNQSVYTPWMPVRMAGISGVSFLSVNTAAKLLGIHHSSIGLQVKKGDIEHILINDRPFIPEYVVILAKTDSDRIYGFKFKAKTDRGNTITNTIFRHDQIAHFLNRYPNGSYKRISKRIRPWKPTTRVFEILDIDGNLCFSCPYDDPDERGIEIILKSLTEESGCQSFICPEKYWLKLKKAFLAAPVKTAQLLIKKPLTEALEDL